MIKILEYNERNWYKSHYVNSEKDLKNIKLAISYLQKLYKDDFMDKYFDEIDKKYGRLQIVNKTIERPTEPPEMVIIEAMRKADSDKTRVKRKLYLLLYKELENWWD